MTYVISDIHGNYNQFEKMLRKIKFNSLDKMYILGDAIDRGVEPIRLLKKIAQMENVFLVIGNHEVMMLDAYAKKPNAYSLWYMNGGKVTDEQFEQLEPDEQDKLLGYLMSSYLVIPNLVVNNRHFYLTHSTHLSRPIKTPVMYKDASYTDVFNATWERQYTNYFYCYPDDELAEFYRLFKKSILICGHTKVQSIPLFGRQTEKGKGRISRGYHGHVIAIDCGCTVCNTLGCLRLDDLKEFYVD